MSYRDFIQQALVTGMSRLQAETPKLTAVQDPGHPIVGTQLQLGTGRAQ